MKKVNLGGDRLGSGAKMEVELHGYERSTFNQGYIWRSTMSAGTLVPFLKELALPGSTWDINLDADIKTHPTLGPLFGSYKLQGDVFLAPIEIYQGQLHNNKLGIGMNMSAVKLPIFTLEAPVYDLTKVPDLDNSQINPSSIFSYLGLRGVGISSVAGKTRDFNAVPWLMYVDTYKNYYANKQEEIGAVIHTPIVPTIESIDLISANGIDMAQAPGNIPVLMGNGFLIEITYTTTRPNLDTVLILLSDGRKIALDVIGGITDEGPGTIEIAYNGDLWGNAVTFVNWDYIAPYEQPTKPIQVQLFDLEQIDNMREYILNQTTVAAAVSLNTAGNEPWTFMLDTNQNSMMCSQEGLLLKTYQSDLFNNWLSEEWIDGSTGVNAITAIDTSSGSFTIDTFIVSKKVWNMLNRIAVSGGSYDDWISAVYDHDRYSRISSPMYQGGLIKELVFQEVVSNSQAQTSEGSQPLGTLAGKGVMSKKHKGGRITVKVDKPSYIMGIVSLTPRIDYSQGTKWDLHLKSMDDFHKPAMDGIGFQDLITEQMAWWDTYWDNTAMKWIQRSAGKQPAWTNYTTNVNEVRGNFAIENNEMFMTLNRRYEATKTSNTATIKDLTTYIDPAKYNHVFADTRLDSQNFWVQIAVDITARKKQSAKVMPNL